MFSFIFKEFIHVIEVAEFIDIKFFVICLNFPLMSVGSIVMFPFAFLILVKSGVFSFLS